MPTQNANIADKLFEFNKTLLLTSFDQARNVRKALCGGIGTATAAARDAGATVVGQARAAVDRTADSAGTGVKGVRGQAGAAVERTVDSAKLGAKEVTGRARAAVDRTVDTAGTGAKEVRGQARAQGERASGRIGEAARKAADQAIDAVDQSPGSGTPYEQWSKAELYERAQELDIDGRSGMSKRQLIAALRS